MRQIALLALVIGCSNIAGATEKEESIELVAARMIIDELESENERLKETIAELKQEIRELEEKVKEQKAARRKGKTPTEDECIKLNGPFNRCGWKCVNGGGYIDDCVNSCTHFIKNKRSKWCLDMWGPGFG